MIANDRTFSLDYSEAIKFRRPSFDVTFESAARVNKNKLAAVLLSGANNDGTGRLKSVVNNGGMAIVQEPSTGAAEFPVMPCCTIASITGAQALDTVKIFTLTNRININ
ncbi:MAG: chemotaxis protein-glutamate methylesterase [Segetibacter sp.]|nr:chemotaxis protein-glutamate methylesterase [Segetibacter sp.]